MTPERDVQHIARVAESGESTRTVVVALVANGLIAIAKSIASVMSGSASMMAEAAHSWADTGNQVFLLIADRRSSAAVIGIVIAVAGIGLHQLTGNAVWDAIGSILVGILLGVIAVVLIDRNRRFLTGEPASDELRDAVVARIEALPEVAEVRFIRLVFVGPKRLFVVASVDLVGDDTESHVARTLRRLESELEYDPHIADAVLTIADPEDHGAQ